MVIIIVMVSNIAWMTGQAQISQNDKNVTFLLFAWTKDERKV